ncbi:hypothetical protein H6F43_03885 [Leptolyngbya sp. FACHB-36]|nr:hypothetical protein [Leptolyngbya sp. FACHB-36]
MITAEQFQAVFGRDCFLLDHFNLRVSLDVVDRMISRSLERSTPPPPHVLTPAPPERIDRTIDLTQAQQLQLLEIDLQFQSDWIASENREAERAARRSWQQAKEMLRRQVITPLITADATGSTLIYGFGHHASSITVLDSPDGKRYQVDTLIHASHPVSPEDLYLRELRVEAGRIIRYRIPGLDDAAWMKQNEPRGPLDPQAWRSLLTLKQGQFYDDGFTP